MSRIFTLTDDELSVNLINTAATGIIAQRGGFGERDVPLGVREGLAVVEQWSFNLKGADHDDAAVQLHTLVKLARRAREFQTEIWRRRRVYLKQQATNETNARHSAVLEIQDLRIPDLFDQPFEGSSEIEGLGMTIVREHPWYSGAPGTLPTATVLGASDGPATPSTVHVANFRDDGDLTHIYVFDASGPTYTEIRTAGNGTALWPAVPAVGDILYSGSTDIAPKHACLQVATAGGFSWTIVAEAYISGAWTAITLGTDFTLYSPAGELASIGDLFKAAGLWSINLFPNANWQTVAVNAVTGYWFRFRLSVVTSTTTVPTKNADTIYAQRKPYVEIPAAALTGDSPARLLIRMAAPSGGGTSPGPANLSRIILGAKSEGLDSFVAHINLGNADNPAAWATAYGTDASATSSPQAPGGAHCAVSFATDINLVARVTLTGDDLLSSYRGSYLALLRMQQIGGVAGDVKVRLRTYLAAQSDKRANADTPSIKSQGADKGPEVVVLGLVRLPFGDTVYNDDLDTTDIIFQILAQRVTGSCTLRLYDLILMPIGEWSAGVDDFASDVTNGNTSLKGGDVLDLDAGVLLPRAQRYFFDGTDLAPLDIWAPMGPMPFLRNVGQKTRIYFLMLHYGAGGSWGAAPLAANLGCHLAVQIYMHTGYSVLRGDQ